MQTFKPSYAKKLYSKTGIWDSYSLFKRFFTYLRDPMKWETMMLGVQEKAKFPQRCCQFSAGGDGVQTPTEGTTMLFLA